MYTGKKRRKGSRSSSKLQNYGLFKRMLSVKPAVYDRHKTMLRLYEKYCDEVSTTKYWGEDDGEDLPTEDVAPAEDTKEDDCDDEFW